MDPHQTHTHQKEHGPSVWKDVLYWTSVLRAPWPRALRQVQGQRSQAAAFLPSGSLASTGRRHTNLEKLYWMGAEMQAVPRGIERGLKRWRF